MRRLRLYILNRRLTQIREEDYSQKRHQFPIYLSVLLLVGGVSNSNCAAAETEIFIQLVAEKNG